MIQKKSYFWKNEKMIRVNMLPKIIDGCIPLSLGVATWIKFLANIGFYDLIEWLMYILFLLAGLVVSIIRIIQLLKDKKNDKSKS